MPQDTNPVDREIYDYIVGFNNEPETSTFIKAHNLQAAAEEFIDQFGTEECDIFVIPIVSMFIYEVREPDPVAFIVTRRPT